MKLILYLLLLVLMFITPSLINRIQHDLDVQPVIEGESEKLRFFWEPLNPSIWEEIAFTADVRSDRKVKSIEWDFGDGTDFISGRAASHEYNEALVYRVRMIVEFADRKGPRRLVYADELEIGDDELVGACPPNTFVALVYSHSLVIESLDVTGCISVDIPEHLIEFPIRVSGLHDLVINYDWERIPENNELQASLFVREIKDGNILAQHPRFRLQPFEEGAYKKKFQTELQDDTEIYFNIVVNLASNPQSDELVLSISSIELVPVEE